MTEVWVFSGAKKHFPDGVFTRQEIAESWILKNYLTGTLTLYPLDLGAYEWAVSARDCSGPKNRMSPHPNSSADSRMLEWSTITTKRVNTRLDGRQEPKKMYLFGCGGQQRSECIQSGVSPPAEKLVRRQ
jgi:hypothetical protein